MKTVIVIPARYKSTRFYGKVLYPLMGKPVIQWVYEKAKKAKISDEIIITSEDTKVVDFAKSIGAKTLITSKKCQSGSDRVWEVVKDIRCDIVVNLQGDEPFINPITIKKTWELLNKRNDFEITTPASKITQDDDIKNPNCVKVVISDDNRAIYFSRSPIPFHHPLSDLSDQYPYYKHIGLYIYRKNALKKFISYPISKLELLERLEQLRAIDNGMKIGVSIVEEHGISIDTLDDIKKAVVYYNKNMR